MSSNLTHEQIALLEYIDLNQAGWWRMALQQVILGILAERERDKQGLFDILSSLLASNITQEGILEQLNTLKNQSKIYEEDNIFYIQESIAREYREAITRQSNEDVICKNLFSTLIMKNRIGLDASVLWEQFVSQLLFPYIKDQGTNFYKVFKTDSIDYNHQLFSSFADCYPDNKANIMLTIREYFSQTIPEVKNFILRQYHAAVALSAAGLSQQVVDSILKAFSGDLSFRVFVDTNVLFSLLDIHKHEQNDLVQNLFVLCKRLPENLIKFVYHPLTIIEAKIRFETELSNIINN